MYQTYEDVEQQCGLHSAFEDIQTIFLNLFFYAIITIRCIKHSVIKYFCTVENDENKKKKN